MSKKELKYTMVLPLWDWSDDGHWKTRDIFIKSNKSIDELQDWYLRCENKYWINIFNIGRDYEDSQIETDIANKLVELGVIPKEVLSDDYDWKLGDWFDEVEMWDDGKIETIFVDKESLVKILLNYIKLDLPDFEYEFAKNETKPLFWFWSEKLNRSLGYWLFN